MFKVHPTIESCIKNDVYTVYSVRTFDHRYSTDFLLFINTSYSGGEKQWVWLDAKDFIPVEE